MPSQLPPKAPTPSSSKTDPSCCDHSPPPLPQRSHSPLLPAALFSLFSSPAKKATCSYATGQERTARRGKEILFRGDVRLRLRQRRGRERKSPSSSSSSSSSSSGGVSACPVGRADQRFNHRRFCPNSSFYAESDRRRFPSSNPLPRCAQRRGGNPCGERETRGERGGGDFIEAHLNARAIVARKRGRW